MTKIETYTGDVHIGRSLQEDTLMIRENLEASAVDGQWRRWADSAPDSETKKKNTVKIGVNAKVLRMKVEVGNDGAGSLIFRGKRPPATPEPTPEPAPTATSATKATAGKK